MTIERLMDKIDEASSPTKMTKGEAIDFLELLIDEIRGRVAALQDEIENEG